MATGTEQTMSGEGVPDPRAQMVLAAKIAVGFVVGFIMVGVVGPIILAVVIGLATGH
jgi:hypothetical protein